MTNERIILEPNEDGVYEPPGGMERAARPPVIKSVGRLILGVGMLVALVFAVMMFVKGGVWAGQKAYPLLSVVSKWAFVAAFAIFTPLGFFKPTRTFGGMGIYITSYLLGLTLWVWSLILTYNLWGLFAVILGLFFAGVGIVPVAMLAALFNGQGSNLLILLALAAFVPLCRWYGISLVARAARERLRG